MFGEYAIYCDEQVVALVCDNQLFVEITPPGRASVGQRYVEGAATLLLGAVNTRAAGSIAAAHSTWTIDELPGVGRAQFTELVPYRTECDHGDSGAAVVDPDSGEVLGLHLGGSSQDDFGLFQPIGPIFERHGLSLAD